MPRTLRIAYGRISLESHALSPCLTTLADFQRTHLVAGAALAAGCQPGGAEAPGFLRNAELSGFLRGLRGIPAAIEAVPLFSAWTVPGGPMDPATWMYFRNWMISALQAAGDLDGVYLALHGALVVPGVEDPEAQLLETVRAVAPNARLVASFDLHANLTPRKVVAVDALVAYRTNPHRDHAQVGARAAHILANTILGRVRPTYGWRTLPLVLGGGNNVDLLQPMRPVYRWMRRAERDPKVLYVSLFQCQPWLADPEIGWAAHVVTDGDPDLAERLADELADRAWAVRHEQPPRFPQVEEAIDRARRARWARTFGAVVMCDASDVVGAGGTGDNTRMLRALLDTAPDLRCLVPLRDPHAVAALWDVKSGQSVHLHVGGTLDPKRNRPLPVTGVVGRRTEAGGHGRRVHLRVGHVDLVLTEGHNLVVRPSFYTDLRLKPWRADIVVVNSLFPFRLFFAPVNRLTIYARTEGITDFDAALLEIERPHPVWPKDLVEDWRPTDRRRRQVG